MREKGTLDRGNKGTTMREQETRGTQLREIRQDQGSKTKHTEHGTQDLHNKTGHEARLTHEIDGGVEEGQTRARRQDETRDTGGA